jgi:hypothetical protein
MRILRVLVIVMGVFIVVATTVLIVLIVHRLSGTPVTGQTTAITAQLDELAGTHIVTIVAAGDRLAIQLQGGGPDRVVLLDPRNGAVVGRIALKAQ